MSSVVARYINSGSAAGGTISGVALSVGKAFHVAPTHPKYKELRALLTEKDNEQAFLALLNAQETEKQLSDVSDGKVTVKDGQVMFEGKPVHNAVSKRVLQSQVEGVPFVGLVRFMEKVSKNPSFRAAAELFDFLDNRDLPVTDDGDFLAYKAVQENYMDIYSGKIRNAVGDVVTMERGKVDDDRHNECSKGLHCGAMDYVTSYGGGNSRIVIVKVNPADAVSVPTDSSFMKLRVCRYEVVAEYSGNLTKSLYNEKAESLVEEFDEDEDDFLDKFDSAYGYDDYDDYQDDDEDYSDVEDEDDEDNDGDNFESGEVTSTPKAQDAPVYGVKPDGKLFYNLRGAAGRFFKRS